MAMTTAEILELFEHKEVDKSWSFAECKPSDTAKWTHGYHRYPAKFIPQLVERLFEEYVNGGNAHINDPFMGSGTTIVSAISRGFEASGTDINRVAYLMTKVKATPMAPEYLERKIKAFRDRLEVSLDGGLFQVEAESFISPEHAERIDYWFTIPNKEKLGIILSILYEDEDPAIREFFLVAFSHILKTCSIWSQSSTKPVRDFHKRPADPLVALKKHLRKMQRGNQAFYEALSPQARQNARKNLHVQVSDASQQPAADASVDLIVTSSPYVTSYEYADLHQLSTIWLNLADDLKEYRHKFIGTAHRIGTMGHLNNDIAVDIAVQMRQRNTRMARAIATYFRDMQAVFEESYRILKPGGRCCYVIGNTRLRKVDILNAEAFAAGLQQAGFVIDRIIKREIPSKILPQKRDEKTGRFAKNDSANAVAYPTEYIMVGRKE